MRRIDVKKPFTTFICTLLLATASWGSTSVINQLRIRAGKQTDSQNFYDGNVNWVVVKNTSGSNQDLKEKDGSGDNGYLYMAFAKTTGLHGEANGFSTPLPITDIIIENYPNGAPENIYVNGRLYRKMHIENQYASTPLNLDNNTSTYGLWLYYTQDFIDGKAITDIIATTKSTTYGQPRITGYDIVTDGSGNPANLIAHAGKNIYNHLHVKKESMELSAKPVVNTTSFSYDPVSFPLEWVLSTSNTTHYKRDNKYEDDAWTKMGDRFDPEPGTYYFYLKNVPSNSAVYEASNVAGPFTIKINKKTTNELVKTIRIKESIYSGEKITVEWENSCVAPGEFNGGDLTPPSDAEFSFSTSPNGSYTKFNIGSEIFINSGTYYIKAYKSSNKYCENINVGPVKITVQQSGIIVKKNNGLADDVIKGHYGDVVNYKLPTLTKEGHTFAGWSKSLPNTIPAGITTIEAKWNIQSYNLTFNHNSPNSSPVYQTKSSTNSCQGNPVDESCYSNKLASTYISKKYVYNAAISYPIWYKVGYTHTGWTLSNGTSSKPTNMPANNLILYAKWTPIQYTLTFDTDGGSTILPITQGFETALVKPANPTKTGFNFVGWDPEFPSKMPIGDKTFKAIWDTTTFYIRFYDGVAATPIKSVAVKYDHSLSAIEYPKTPTRTGYTFNGWSLTSLPEKMPADNIIVTAKWTANKYKVSIPSQLEICNNPQFVDDKLTYGTTVKLTVKEGYRLLSPLRYGDKELTPNEAGIYSFMVADKDANVTATISEDYGSIQILVDHSEAIIGYDALETKEISEPIEVDSVTFVRRFSKNVTETVMLPFDIDLQYVRGGIFCKFMGVGQENGKWTIRLLFVSTALEANIPYLFVPTSTKMLFKLPEGQKLAIRTSENATVRSGDWEFRGTYDYTDWVNLKQEERAYSFNANGVGDGVSGTFQRVKSTDNPYPLNPLQGYLIYNPITPQGRPALSIEQYAPIPLKSISLPEEIEVKIENENGGTTALGKINTRTGEMKIDRWFDLQGRALKCKPTSKGVYYNNGKKVTVK